MKKFNSLNESLAKRNQKQNSPPVAECGGKRNRRKNTESRGPGWVGKALIGFAGSGWGIQKRFWTMTAPSTERGERRDWETPSGAAVSYDSLWTCGAQGMTTWLPSCCSEITTIDPGKRVVDCQDLLLFLGRKWQESPFKKNRTKQKAHLPSVELNLHYALVKGLQDFTTIIIVKTLPMKRTDISERRNNWTAYMHTG